MIGNPVRMSLCADLKRQLLFYYVTLKQQQNILVIIIYLQKKSMKKTNCNTIFHFTFMLLICVTQRAFTTKFHLNFSK